MQDILSAVGIVVVLVIVVVLFFYVKKQRDNHVQLYVYMYGSVLDGRLRNLIVKLEDFAVFFHDGTIGSGQEKIQLDGLCELDTAGLHKTLFELLEKNGLGVREKRNLQRGFDSLQNAITLIHFRLSETQDTARLLSQENRMNLRYLLTEAAHAFEMVRRKTVY